MGRTSYRRAPGRADRPAPGEQRAAGLGAPTLLARASSLPSRALAAWIVALTGLTATIVPAMAGRPPLKPMAIWHMDHIRGGRMPDLSGKGNAGLVHNVGLAPHGFHGRAYYFNGRTSGVVIPPAPSLNPGKAAFQMRVRVKLWVRPRKGHNYDLLRKGVSGARNGYYKLEILHNGRPRCVFAGFRHTVLLSKGPNVVDGGWHTITCLKTSDMVRLETDKLHVQRTAQVGHIWNGAILTVGFRKDKTDRYKGLMDDLRIARGPRGGGG